MVSPQHGFTRRKRKGTCGTLKRKGGYGYFGRKKKPDETAEERGKRLLREKSDEMFLSERHDTMLTVQRAVTQRMKYKCLTNVEIKELKDLLQKSMKTINTFDRTFVRNLENLHQVVVYIDEAILKDVLSKKAPCGGVYEAIPKKSDLDSTIERRILRERVRLDPNFEVNDYLQRVSRDPDLTQKRVENRGVLKEYKKVQNNKGKSTKQLHEEVVSFGKRNKKSTIYEPLTTSSFSPVAAAKIDAQTDMSNRTEENIRRRSERIQQRDDKKQEQERFDLKKQVDELEKQLEQLNMMKSDFDGKMQTNASKIRNIQNKLPALKTKLSNFEKVKI